LSNFFTRKLKVFLPLLFAFNASCTQFNNLKNTAVEFALQFVPVEADEKLGEYGFKSIRNQMVFLSQPEIQSQLNTLAEPLLTLGNRLPEVDKFKWKLHVAESSVPNAFALPGGYLVFHTGFFQFAQSADEFFGVLAHEMGHVTERHGTGGTITNLGFSMVLQLILGDVGSVVGTAIQGAAHLTLMNFSRNQETRADEKALVYLNAAGLPHTGILSFFERLNEKKSGISKSAAFEKLESVLSTHPLPLERVENLKSKQSETVASTSNHKVAYLKLKEQVLATLSDSERRKHENQFENP
jgi:beta-barrel assembly-enhancing protease